MIELTQMNQILNVLSHNVTSKIVSTQNFNHKSNIECKLSNKSFNTFLHQPWATAASFPFSSGLSCNIVSITGRSLSFSLPGFRKMNCSKTFFKYSRLATDFSRSWFLSNLLISLLRSWCWRNELKMSFRSFRLNMAGWTYALFFSSSRNAPKNDYKGVIRREGKKNRWEISRNSYKMGRR